MASQPTWGSTNFAAVPPPFPETAGAPMAFPRQHVRRWNVTHACDAAECVLPLAEAQAEIGMRPAVLTPSGWFNDSGPAPMQARVSLIHAWREVRHWRSLFDEQRIGALGEVLHAHCFSAAMAGIRAGACVVYDFSAPVGASAGAGPWLTRSLRVAEGFVLTRAAAVVVHTQRMWDAAVAQGTRPEDLFLIPDPVAFADFGRDESGWLEQLAGTRPGMTVLAAADSDVETVLRAFATLAEEVEDAHLLIECAATQVERYATELEIADRVHPVGGADRARALACSHIVIAGSRADGPNQLALDALAHNRALLAADVPANREVTPHGRGCLWYGDDSARDLAFRAAFLARNADFRSALAASGRAHLQATRGGAAVARRYDEVYRHAAERHRGPDLLHRVPALALCC